MGLHFHPASRIQHLSPDEHRLYQGRHGYGLKELYGMKTVVTAGVGYYGAPIRVGTDSEITVIDLTY